MTKNVKTREELETEEDMRQIQVEVDSMTNAKMKSFSFEVKPGWKDTHYPEIDDIQTIVDNTMETYRILKRAGKFAEAKLCRQKIAETIYAQDHLRMVMNMDFMKPRGNMKKMVEEHGVDLSDPSVQSEFKRMQE